MAFAGKSLKLENIMLSEISQSQKSKSGIFSLISGWWHNGWWEWVKNGRRRDCIEGKERWEGWGEGKYNGMNQTSLLYVNIWICKWYAVTPCTNRNNMYAVCLQLKINFKKFSKMKSEPVLHLYFLIYCWIQIERNIIINANSQITSSCLTAQILWNTYFSNDCFSV